MSDRGTIRDSRLSYERDALDETSVARDPHAQFERWIHEALAEQGKDEANAMALATVGSDGRPSLRIVLLRGYDERGFAFYTNYDSRKGRELAGCGDAALLFYWPALERELRIEGEVERLSSDESDAYFATRPRGHRLSAWASDQSEPVADRRYLEDRMAAAEARFPGDDVPRPAYWGGYRVVPRSFEFWQGRPNRVHDRIVYERDGAGWKIVRLSP